MPWKEKNVVNLRKEFVLKALGETMPFSDLCRQYGISRKTGYKWKERFVARGLAGLADISRRPARCPTETDEDTVCEMIRLKKAHDAWGPRKIRTLYARAHPDEPLPSDSTFKRILDKAGFVERRTKRRSSSSGRLQSALEAKEPNDVWTVDFKGWWYTTEGARCEPLTIRDDYSRFVFCAAALDDAQTRTVRRQFERTFALYGLPRVIRSDNGSPFASINAPLGLTRLSAWWIAQGIDLDRIPPGRPDQNGGHERMHRDIAQEVQARYDGDLRTWRAVLDTWLHTFNHERPHEALDMRSPADVYTKSTRPYDPTPPQLTYDADCIPRKVNCVGAIRLHGERIPISSSLAGWHVGLRPRDDQRYTLTFGRLTLGEVDLSTRAFHPLIRGAVAPPKPRHRPGPPSGGPGPAPRVHDHAARKNLHTTTHQETIPINDVSPMS